MKFSVVNAVVLLLLIVLTGVFYMKKSKEIAVVNIDAIYNQSAAGDMVRKHLNEVKSILEKGYEVLSSGVVLAHNESADITKEVMALVEKENLVFNQLPKVEVHNKNEEKPEQSK